MEQIQQHQDDETPELVQILLAAQVVTVGSHAYTGRDVIAAALVAGTWEPFEAEVAAREAACVAQPPEKAAIEQAVKEFRYSRRLIAAEEFVTWLKERDLTLSLVRESRARAVAVPLDGDASEPIPRDYLLEALAVDATVSGLLGSTATWLSQRLVALGDGEPTEQDRTRAHALGGREEALVISQAFATEDVAAREERLARLIAADRLYNAESGEQTSDSSVAATIKRHGMDWMRVEFDELEAAHEGAAAEAAAQLREGASPERVASSAGSQLQLLVWRICDTPEQFQGPLVSASEGDTVGPHDHGGRLVVWKVRRRIVPSLNDPDVRAQANTEILAGHWSRRTAGKVSWHGRH